MPTTNPVPSQDPSDLLFNAGKLDEVLNGTGTSFTDRLGTARRTVAGMNADFDAQLADAESDLNVYRADAAASAAQALGYLNTIRTTSYGAYASDPVTDPLGNPPTEGDEYFNTTSNLLKHWNGTTWQASDINTANLAAPSGSSLIGYDTGTVQDVLDGAKSLQDYAALRAYTGRATRIYITGLPVAAKPAGTSGVFQYDPNDTSSLDNGGTIIVGSDGRRWKRDHSGAVNVKWFGAVGDGFADATHETSAIQAAIDSINPYEHQVASVSQTPFSAVIFLPRGTYNVFTIEHRNGVILRGEGGTNLITTSNAPVIRQAANTYTNPLNPNQTHSAYGIELLTIYGSNDPQTGLNTLQDGIYLGYDDRYNSASHSFIRNVVITSMQGNGIRLHKPAVANDQWGWTQFGIWSNVLITSCAGYGFIASGVTGKADFASMLLEQFFVGACFSGGILINGGNDNRIQGTSASIGFTRGLTNTSCDDNVVLNDQLFTELDIHIENSANPSAYGVNIGKTAACYSTSIRGLFYDCKNPIKITSNNGCNIDNVIFTGVPVGNYCITNYGRYTEIGKNWYQTTTGALFLNDQVSSPELYAATGYITPNALTFGPTNLYTSSTDYPANISANGVSIGLGGSTTSTKVGKDALKFATGAQNTAFGYQAGLGITTGGKNTAVGTNALISVTTAENGTAVGQNALLSATGGNNTAIGASAGLNVTTGANNVFLGYVAGADALANITTQSGQVVVGNNTTTTATIKVAWTVVSDKRDKTNFGSVPHGLGFVNSLKPVSYQFKESRDSEQVLGPKRYGFFAQDILECEGADPVIVNAEDGERLKYTESYLLPVLVNAIQELSKRIDELEMRT